MKSASEKDLLIFDMDGVLVDVNASYRAAIQATVSQGPNGQKPDALWTSDPGHWLTAIAAMLVLGIVWMIIARIRLAKIGPRRRKKSKNKPTVPNQANLPVGAGMHR